MTIDFSDFIIACGIYSFFLILFIALNVFKEHYIEKLQSEIEHYKKENRILSAIGKIYFRIPSDCIIVKSTKENSDEASKGGADHD